LKELAKQKDMWEYFNSDLVNSSILKQPTPPTVDAAIAAINEVRHDQYLTQHDNWEQMENNDEREPKLQSPARVTDQCFDGWNFTLRIRSWSFIHCR
jgi:hypothetical protein